MTQFEPRVELAFLVRLIVAGALAAVLGWERQAAHKSAGLRTLMLVGIASALFTVLGELSVGDYAGKEAGLRSDPLRVIQAVAIGIGFLGSGVIFVSKDGDQVRDLRPPRRFGRPRQSGSRPAWGTTSWRSEARCCCWWCCEECRGWRVKIARGSHGGASSRLNPFR